MSSGIPSKSVYLQPEFDSSSLKVAQLRGILLEHSVHAPSTAKKAELVELFEERVKSRADDLLSEAADVQPSDDGIVHVDGRGRETVVSRAAAAAAANEVKTPRKRARASVAAEGVAVHDSAGAAVAATPSAMKKTPGRRRTIAPQSSTNVIEAASAGTDDRRALVSPPVPVTPAAANRRRTMGGPTSASADMDAAAEPMTGRRVSSAGGRKSLVAAPPPRSAVKKVPSVAALREEEGDEAGGGAASASEADKGKEKVSRVDEQRSAPEVGRGAQSKKFKIKSRLSDDDEAGFSDYNPFQSGGGDSPMPVPLKERKKRKSTLRPQTPIDSPASDRLGDTPASPPVSPPSLRKFQPHLPSLASPVRVQQRVVSEDVTELPAISSPAPRRRRLTTSAIPLTGLAIAFVAWIYTYKQGSSELGFCDTGSNVNAIVLDQRYRIAQAEACVRERSKEMDEAARVGREVKMEACPHEEDLPLLSFIPSPDACAVCPSHAQCNDGHFVKCDLDYIEKLHPLAWLAPVANGLPGLGPVAFPPTCEKDYKRKKQVLEIARALDRKLAVHRGEVLCGRRAAKGQPDTIAYGYQERQLLDDLLARTTLPRETFILNFEEALADLLDHGDATRLVNGTTGISYIAGTRAEMPLTCRLRLAATTKARENKQWIALGASGLALVAYVRSMIRSRRAEARQIKELVQVALDRLQDEQTHILPDQLRDFVLAEMHIPARRQEIWKRVRPIIESNANVHVSEVELHGDTWPAWQWVGVSKLEQESKRQSLPAYPVA